MEQKKMTDAETREVMLRLMDVIDDICRKNNIKYSLSAGSLLGAVRHKGFIPWDDDMDIMMLREDYDRFVSIIKKDYQNYDSLLFLDYEIDVCYVTFSKLCDARTQAVMYNRGDDNIQYGVWIDIFPFENFPSTSDKERERFMRKCQFWRAMIIAMQTKLSHEKFGLKFISKSVLKLVSYIIGKKKVTLMAHNFMTKYNVDETNYTGCTYTPYLHEFFDKNLLSEVVDYSFEGHTYKGFANYDYYLSRIYGDYMTPPPVEKRIAHSVTAYWK